MTPTAPNTPRTPATPHERSERIAAVVTQASTRLPADRSVHFERFAHGYFHHMEADDLASRSSDDLAGALLSAWQWGQQREPGQPKLRVLSPSVGEQGWASRHSIIEVVNDDMPFLVDTTTMEVNHQGLTLHLIVHPVLTVQRDAQGQLLAVLPRGAEPPDEGALRESWIHVEVDRMVDASQRAALLAGLQGVLADVRAVVSDWKPMLTSLHVAIDELAGAAGPLPQSELEESLAFLRWLADDHLTLLGYRRHDLVNEQGEDGLRMVPGSGLGVLRESDDEKLSASFAALPAQARALARSPTPSLVVTRANTRSTVHRPGYTDYVGVKRYDGQGQVIGEHRFVGLYTSSAYGSRASDIPLLRGKIKAVIDRSALPRGGHLHKALEHILATYPRDDLVQIGVDDLHRTAMGILAASERHRLRLFTWRDPFERFVSCLIYVPRESYSTELRIKFQAILMQALGGVRSDFDVQLGNSILARVHLTIRTGPGSIPDFDVRHIEARMAEAARRWDDKLRDALVEEVGEAHGMTLYKQWGTALPQVYREVVPARAAVPDVLKAAAMTAEQPLAMTLYRPLGSPPQTLGFKVYHLGPKVVLSDSLPMLENMGARVLSENNFRIGAGPDGEAVAGSISMHDFLLEAQVADEIEPEALSRLFEDAFAKVFRGEIESDEINRLVLRAGLAADELVILRAYAKYLRQIGFALSQSLIRSTLVAHPRIARMLVGLFKLKFDPMAHNDDAAAAQVEAIELALDKVSNLAEDRLLRQILALIQATLRTNYWRTGVGHSGQPGPRRSFLSFKFDAAKVPGMPAPRPLVEIFVYSPRFEGIHLRGGRVARGGLRWSDRTEDFRTEILGLVKAQMVKNTVIVPVGSKGGFVLKKAPPATDREAWLAEGVACYQDYLRGLLDLTDNRVGDAIVPPPLVRRLDDDDPYLVVAADKGTASFSDYANAVSAEYGHWLGDAFASGGSVGYDHKAMGITARGAWESVKRHFRELGVDTQTTDFTVVGVGDMSGDVFGNGMLLSRHIRLLAAFDHRHIFIDPDPDAATSWAERERLFKLPRSSWADYDTQHISAGGGVWSRSEKSIPISPQARAALGITAERLPPTELLSAILRAPADLLYNGGIGTYVKCSQEDHADVGDRANDALRVDGKQLRCKVLAEGGNLGCTQLGRIEAARCGVRIYTDAIDNSAGVDTSDHEVNIKILLGLVTGDGEMTERQRNTLLPQMTDEIADLVLRDNYRQTQALSIARRQAAELLDRQARFMRHLEKIGKLDRGIEFLPTDEQIAERKARGEGLHSPEMAVLLAYSKMWLSERLMDSDLADDPWVAGALQRYFPALLQERFGAWIPRHPLKREIVVTHVLNEVVNRVGASFVHRLTEITDAPPAPIVRAYLAMSAVFGLEPLFERIEALDNEVDDAVQAAMIITLKNFSLLATAWFLHPRRQAEAMQTLIDRLVPAVQATRDRLEPALTGAEPVTGWTAAGVPDDLARSVAAAHGLFSALDIAEVCESSGESLQDTSDLHYQLGDRLGLQGLKRQVDALSSGSYWDNLAKIALVDDVSALQRALTLEVLHHSQGSTAERLQAWEADKHAELASAQRLVADLAEAQSADLAMLSVAMRKLRNLA
jgi:glutamate dehydrogenase